MTRFARLLVFTLMCVFTVSCMTATTTAEKSETKDGIFTDVNLESVVMSVKTLEINKGIANETMVPIFITENSFNMIYSYDATMLSNDMVIKNDFPLLIVNQVTNEFYNQVNDVGKQFNKMNNYSTLSHNHLRYDLPYNFKQARDGLRNNYLSC